MSLQLATIIGNATKDAEQRSSKDGVNYLTFRLAVSGYGDKPTFYNIVVFGKYGEVLKDHITRGRKVFASGRLQINDKGYVSVVADHIELLAQPKKKVQAEAIEPQPETKEV
ncbi:MAG: single-stranded DNA-binding protein [Candidatus Chisholmbacteria bacterium]|nr:single-stranded DNA-binding protein [Candidatus Chisholmbacteria bacterium]